MMRLRTGLSTWLLLICFFPYSANGQIEFRKSLLCDGDPNTKTAEQLSLGGIMLDVLAASPVGTVNECDGWTNLGLGGVFYLKKAAVIYGVDTTTKKYLGGWPLGSNLTDCKLNEVCNPWYIGRWGSQEYIEPEVADRITTYGLDVGFHWQTSSIDTHAAGCFVSHPMRYGDVDGDGKNELVMFLRDAFVIFSTRLNKTIFATMLENRDYIDCETLRQDGMNLDKGDDEPQFCSTRLVEANQGTDIGYRGYAKLYSGDFDLDKRSDLVVWRKFYVSRLEGDPVKGFQKGSDTFLHYTLIDGEYKKQETAQDVIKGWLTGKHLTWQQGWPSTSECPGEEGKLIPEMHDPLLNDPEVLAADVVATSAPVAQASFDCGKASTPVEKLICSSDVLKQQDVQLATAYKAARAKADASGQRTLKDSQVAFIKARQAKCQTAECIQAETQRRLQELASEGETLGRGR